MLKHEDPVLLVSVTRWNALWQGAASSVALWDHMSTLDQEIELIWLRKWSFTSFLYFITRYVADISFIHAIVSAWSYGRFLDNICPTFFRVQSWLSQVAMLAMNVIVVKRVVCMYSGDKKVLWALTITLSTLTVHGAILTVLMSDIPSVVARIQSTHLYEVCEPFPTESTPSWYWTFVIFMFVFEALVFGLALLQVVSFVRERRQTRRDWDGASMLGHVWKTRRDLASVLLRDSILFPFINLIIATLNILVWAAELSPNSAESIRLVAAVTVPMFGCRLLLNLRDIYYEPFREEYNLSRFQRGPSDVIN